MLTDKQTNRQTNAGHYITSLADVMMHISMALNCLSCNDVLVRAPLFSTRQHPISDDCLEAKREDCLNFLTCFVVYRNCTQQYALTWAVVYNELGPVGLGFCLSLVFFVFMYFFLVALSSGVTKGDMVECPPVRKETRSLAIAKRPCDCCIILKSGSYTKAIQC